MKTSAVQITSIEAHPGCWAGSAIHEAKKYLWYYWPRSRLRFQEEDEINPRAWMTVDPPEGAKGAVLKAVRLARQG